MSSIIPNDNFLVVATRKDDPDDTRFVRWAERGERREIVDLEMAYKNSHDDAKYEWRTEYFDEAVVAKKDPANYQGGYR